MSPHHCETQCWEVCQGDQLKGYAIFFSGGWDAWLLDGRASLVLIGQNYRSEVGAVRAVNAGRDWRQDAGEIQDLSPEEAQAAYDAAPEVPLSKERIDEIVAYATQPRCVCGHIADQHANIGGSGACRVRSCPCEQWHDTPAPERCECAGCWRESNMPPVGSVDVL